MPSPQPKPKLKLKLKLKLKPFPAPSLLRETHEYIHVACSGILPPILPEEGGGGKRLQL